MIRDASVTKNCVRRALFSVLRTVYCLYWIKTLVLRQIASECTGLQRVVDTFKTDLTIGGVRTF